LKIIQEGISVCQLPCRKRQGLKERPDHGL